MIKALLLTALLCAIYSAPFNYYGQFNLKVPVKNIVPYMLPLVKDQLNLIFEKGIKVDGDINLKIAKLSNLVLKLEYLDLNQIEFDLSRPDRFKVKIKNIECSVFTHIKWRLSSSEYDINYRAPIDYISLEIHNSTADSSLAISDIKIEMYRPLKFLASSILAHKMGGPLLLAFELINSILFFSRRAYLGAIERAIKKEINKTLLKKIYPNKVKLTKHVDLSLMPSFEVDPEFVLVKLNLLVFAKSMLLDGNGIVSIPELSSLTGNSVELTADIPTLQRVIRTVLEVEKYSYFINNTLLKGLPINLDVYLFQDVLPSLADKYPSDTEVTLEISNFNKNEEDFKIALKENSVGIRFGVSVGIMVEEKTFKQIEADLDLNIGMTLLEGKMTFNSVKFKLENCSSTTPKFELASAYEFCKILNFLNSIGEPIIKGIIQKKFEQIDFDQIKTSHYVLEHLSLLTSENKLKIKADVFSAYMK